MFRTPIRSAAVIGAAGLLAGAVAAPSVAADARHRHPAKIKHVLLLSVDGLHQSDLAWYVKRHPHSALAAITAGGVDYTGASTPLPSDSFPGMVGQVTGGDPRAAGVYYDDTYNHALLPAGTTSCKGVKPGVEVDYTEDLDKNKASIDAGQGLTGLPGSVLGLTGHPETLLNPAKLPVDPKTCKPVYPHSYLKVNTVFEVAKAHGYRTAWSDKHPAYEILNGPSGKGLDDLFTPEINSDAPGGGDWTTDNASTRKYDGYKVQAVLNEIDGYDHAHKARVGTPGILGMNFQSVSTAQKLPTSDGQTGGYLPNGTPGPLLSSALDWVNSQVGRMKSEIKRKGLAKNTAIILSAKHGQSPAEPQSLTRIDDGPIIAAINKAWAATHPKNTSLVTFSTDDDAIQMWLSDRSQKAADFVGHWLLTHPATGNTITGAPRTLKASGLTRVYAGKASAKLFGVPQSDPRHPDVWGFVQHGVVYTGGKKKIAEHGGGDAADRHVPLVVFVPGVKGAVVRSSVETTQIAPTILKLLGLNPNALQAVRVEHTKPLR